MNLVVLPNTETPLKELLRIRVTCSYFVPGLRYFSILKIVFSNEVDNVNSDLMK